MTRQKQNGQQTPEVHLFFSFCPSGPGDRVLDLGWEGKFEGHGRDQDASEVCFVSSDIRSIKLCKKGLGTNGNHRAFLSAAPADELNPPFDLVRYRPAQRAAKEQVFEWIDQGFDLLKLGGCFFLAGRKDRGVESYAKRLKAVFGRVDKVGQAGRTRIYCARKSQPSPACDGVDTRYVFDIHDLSGGPYRFETRAGVFSRDGLDPGTRFLIEQVPFAQYTRMLDLGCGCGAIGIVGAKQVPKGSVTLVDVDLRSIHCALKNLGFNGVDNARVLVGDGFAPLEGEAYDLIVSNPPFHEGNATGHDFIDGAAKHLVSEGDLWMVVMRAEPYRKRMEIQFEAVEEVGQRDGYTVLRAQFPRREKIGKIWEPDFGGDVQ
ncbi:MAG: class I SAM-dependent methyltransferase [bacterium]|nr:class I SAM-dependent methyltransferase [bacterium]